MAYVRMKADSEGERKRISKVRRREGVLVEKEHLKDSAVSRAELSRAELSQL